MSGTELVIILVLGLLLFGPDRLPQMARMLGSAMREFQKATGDIRSTVESEFHKLADLDPQAPAAQAQAQAQVKVEPARGAVAAGAPAQPDPAAATRRDDVLARLERALPEPVATPDPAAAEAPAASAVEAPPARAAETPSS